jgi:hypothetical protein
MESNEPVHPIFRNVPAPDTVLWRYLSFAKLISLLHVPRLHFTRVDLFDDHFEGAWPKSDLEYWSKIEGGGKAIYFTEMMRQRVAVSCWLESSHESAAMWRLYASGEEGVAITTTFGKLQKLVDDAVATTWLAGVGRVTYIDHAGAGLFEGLQENEPLPNTLAPFMLKHISYAHEREVRALLVAGKGNEVGRQGVDLALDVNNFVDQIVINPFCQPWFTEAVTGLVSGYGLATKLRPSALSPSAFYKDEFYASLKKRR